MQANRESVLTILAPALMFLSGFVTYIFYHDYGILTPEVLLSILAITLAGMFVGGLLADCGFRQCLVCMERADQPGSGDPRIAGGFLGAVTAPEGFRE
jgi:hypothetical protein